MNWPVAMRLAGRELRGGWRGFRIFLACLALGVAAMAGVGSVREAFLNGLGEEGQVLLGGDIKVVLTHRPATEEEAAFLESWGTVARVVEFRTMARAVETQGRNLVELKAVDTLYPMFGEVGMARMLEPGLDFQSALSERDGLPGMVAERAVLDRLGLDLGQRVRFGTQEFEIRGVFSDEPDRVAGTFRLGPRVFIALDALEATGLVRQGSLIFYGYRIALPAELSESAALTRIDDFREAAEEKFPDAGWRIRDRRNGAPGTERFVRQVALFLTLVGLTALLVGGVGVGNAVRTYLERKRAVIATFKCLGAEGGTVFAVYLYQVLAIAFVGIAAGLAFGALAPFAVASLLGDSLAVPVRLQVYPQALILAAAYGVATTIGFAVWPLARAREIPAAGLFRDLIAPVRAWPRLSYVIATVAAFAMLAALAIFFTDNRMFALVFLAGAAVVIGILQVLARAVMAAARRLGAPPVPELRIALANLHRPGAPTPSVVLSLGLGLTLLTAIILIDGNITRQLSDSIPKNAPSYFFVDIQRDQVPEFDRLVGALDGIEGVTRVPNMRGRITAIKGVASGEAQVEPGARWVLRGDTSLTYSEGLPENSTLAEGEWWPKGYTGPPLVSVHSEIARGFGVSVGDTITFNILGREIEARVASTRDFDWRSIGVNFVFVFPPKLLEAAPHMHVAAVRAKPETEETLYRAVTDAFPNVSAVRVKEALTRINDTLTSLATGLRAASGVTLAAGILVLAGVMAAGHRRRVYDAVLFKVLGAERRRILSAYLAEYALLGLVTAGLALGAGTLAAWLTVRFVMEAPWVFLPGAGIATIVLGTLVTVLLGLAGTWRVLGQKAAPVLRSE